MTGGIVTDFDRLSAGLRGHRDADAAARQRAADVPQILARGRLGAIPHLRGEPVEFYRSLLKGCAVSRYSLGRACIF